MTTTVHRNSISRRSSALTEQQSSQRRKDINTTATTTSSSSKTTGTIAATMSRIEYLNRKFNVNPSFEIDITDDDINDDGKSLPPPKPSNDEFLQIDVSKQKRAIDTIGDSISMSMSLLEPVNKYIDDFQLNLQSLSNEMQVLQARLQGLNQDIDKCKKLDLLLTPVLNDLLLSPKCVTTLVEGKIDEEWVLQLIILLEKKEILQKTGEKYNSEDVTQIFDLIEQLELNCVARIKKYMVDTIKYLRVANASSVPVQENLLKVKEMFKFLQERDEKLAKELETAYLYTMRWYYYFNFVKYISSLEGLRVWNSDYDTGDDRSSRKTSSTISNTNTSNTSASLMLDNSNVINEYLINLPKRFEQMEDENGNKFAILAQIAETARQSGVKFFMEQVTHFLNSTIVDNATIEFTFIVDFFSIENNEEMSSMLKQIFQPVYKLGANFTKFLLGQCSSDYFGIMHNIKRIHSMQLEVQQRCLPESLETYLDTLLMLLWPALQKDMDVLCSNLNNTMNSTSVIKSVVSSKNNIQVPLQVTQSFSTVLSGLVQFLGGAVEDSKQQSPLHQSITRLSSVYEKGLVQLAATLSAERGKLFLYVNLQQVAIVLDTAVGSSPLTTHYEQLVRAHSP